MTTQALTNDLNNTRHVPTGEATRIDKDSSGYAVFSTGETGAAHVMAHRMLDKGHIELGHQALGEWLHTHTGHGSNWVHLQFHMAIFELEIGHWDAAYKRFISEILPTAETTEEALTDAPALLWRLMMTGPTIAAHWTGLQHTASWRMHRYSEPFVELHNLLALAGAGDEAGISEWLERQSPSAGSRHEHLVQMTAFALRDYVRCDFKRAASQMQALAPQISEVGGSRAQNLLFSEMADWFRKRADDIHPAKSRERSLLPCVPFENTAVAAW